MNNRINDIFEEEFYKIKEIIYKLLVKIYKLFTIINVFIIINIFIIYPYTGINKDTDFFIRIVINAISALWVVNIIEIIMLDFPHLREKIMWFFN